MPLSNHRNNLARQASIERINNEGIKYKNILKYRNELKNEYKNISVSKLSFQKCYSKNT